MLIDVFHAVLKLMRQGGTPANFPFRGPDRAVLCRIRRYTLQFAARSAFVDMDGAGAVGHHGEP